MRTRRDAEHELTVVEAAGAALTMVDGGFLIPEREVLP